MDFHKTWYKLYATKDYPSFAFLLIPDQEQTGKVGVTLVSVTSTLAYK
jgi:hypothetical protein